METDEKPLGDEGVKYVETLGLEQLSKWYALFMAIDSIDEFCKNQNKECLDDHLKPIPIKHFIDAKAVKILNDLQNEQRKAQTNKQFLLDELLKATKKPIGQTLQLA